jgi:hypothetical protein
MPSLELLIPQLRRTTSYQIAEIDTDPTNQFEHGQTLIKDFIGLPSENGLELGPNGLGYLLIAIPQKISKKGRLDESGLHILVVGYRILRTP